MQPILERCCGVDVHKEIIEACIIKGFDEPEMMREQFETNPAELKRFALWLYDNECFHIAMESTGVYWRPVYEAIEDHCRYYEHIVVANAHHMRNLPGRKNDVKDAQWIATLLQHGLLEPSFVPDRNIRDLREFSRSYKNCVSERVRVINRMEKFLQTHGFKLSSVLSDITSVSGMNILQLLAKNGNLTVADVRDCLRGNTKHTAIEIAAAVCGSLNGNEQFLLDDFLTELLHINAHIKKIVAKMLEISEEFSGIIKILDSIPGIDIVAALLIIAEIGIEPVTHFKSSAHLASWAGLSPRNDKSAGKIMSKRILPGNPYIKSILCQVAWVSVKSRKNHLSQWFWSHQSKLGKKKAIIAVSRKLLVLIYFLISHNIEYDSKIALAAVA